jgi:hypothetical protein
MSATTESEMLRLHLRLLVREIGFDPNRTSENIGSSIPCDSDMSAVWCLKTEEPLTRTFPFGVELGLFSLQIPHFNGVLQSDC